MIIKNEKPPIYERAKEIFEIDDEITIYTYGNIIYNPGNININDELLEHESVHERQQEEIGGPEIWWEKYFNDEEFRFKQEAEAYAAQYRYYCKYQKDRNKQAKYLFRIGEYLSSPMYMANVDSMTAIREIKSNTLSRY